MGDCPAWRTPQIEDLREAVRAADAGEFASGAEVQVVFDRHAPRPSRPGRKGSAESARNRPRRGQVRSR